MSDRRRASVRPAPGQHRAAALAAAALDAEHGPSGVVERKALRRGKSEAQLGMEKTAAADETFARILAIDETVDVGEIGRFGLGKILPGIGRSAILAGARDCVGNALGRRRMR